MLYIAVPAHAYAPNRQTVESRTGRNGDALIAAEADVRDAHPALGDLLAARASMSQRATAGDLESKMHGATASGGLAADG